ncbi:hypothetical protein FGO68_gene13015 [Halteria grandinella]|uniref:Uncharacterized protein n=1 Tax=Halteria grandinella TaxID=5974 RepID=A0A8J8NXH7_HALGN|nr:hypothetical protein FGO68_gene13015 [Halteria grandinella]
MTAGTWLQAPQGVLVLIHRIAVVIVFIDHQFALILCHLSLLHFVLILLVGFDLLLEIPTQKLLTLQFQGGIGVFN